MTLQYAAKVLKVFLYLTCHVLCTFNKEANEIVVLWKIGFP